ncbi:MAG: isocitrate lyase/phosphoenolpyruvate mutase family protein [Candidatus Omnitrophica bacterium]|nr:isocitrate lyase/phosphoenolpyruvate mutase family protein [Candidatus Omnitrophota bacterium]
MEVKTGETKAEKLRKLFAEKDLIRVVGAHDGLGAKLIERNGFDAVWASGFEIATSHAVPDANILTMTQHLDAAEVINDATSLPVIADCDTGYGNSNNVIHMVKRYEAAGIAAVCIEDKKFPKVNSFIDGRQELAPVHEFVGKIMAAKNAQQSRSFMVIARVEALIAGWGEEEALKRAEAYVTAGADAILIHSKAKTPDEIISFVEKWHRRAPVIIIPTKYPALTEDKMKQLGVKVVIYANQGIRAAIKAMDSTLAQIHKHGIAGLDGKIATMEEVFELQGMYRMKEDEKKFLHTASHDVRAVILAAGYNKNESSLVSLLRDAPLAMLDINGKSLLERNVATLRSVGVSDIYVVAGYQEDKIRVDGIKKIVNRDYASKHILHSLMTAEEALKGKVIVSYVDILFDHNLADRLLKCDDDIVLVVDSSFKKTKMRNKKLDLVAAETHPADGFRSLDTKKKNHLKRVGKGISEKEADFEYIGVSLFSAKGIKLFKDTCRAAMEQYRSKRFHEAADIERASFTDLIQELVEQGAKINLLEVTSGWMEIQTFEDYKRASKVV